MPPVGVSSQLPEWIQERLVIPRGYGEVQSGLVRFFRAHAEKEGRARRAGDSFRETEATGDFFLHFFLQDETRRQRRRGA